MGAVGDGEEAPDKVAPVDTARCSRLCRVWTWFLESKNSLEGFLLPSLPHPRPSLSSFLLEESGVLDLTAVVERTAGETGGETIQQGPPPQGRLWEGGGRPAKQHPPRP